MGHHMVGTEVWFEGWQGSPLSPLLLLLPSLLPPLLLPCGLPGWLGALVWVGGLSCCSLCLGLEVPAERPIPVTGATLPCLCCAALLGVQHALLGVQHCVCSIAGCVACLACAVQQCCTCVAVASQVGPPPSS